MNARMSSGPRKCTERVLSAIIIGIVTTVGLFVSLAPNAEAEPAGASVWSEQPFEIEEYAQQVGVSGAQAEEDLTLQHRDPLLVEHLQKALGAEFAGVWFDAKSGEFVVPTPQPTDAGLAEVAPVFRAAKLGSAFRLQGTDYSWEELEKAHSEIDDQLSELLPELPVRTSLDPEANAVVVEIGFTAASDDREVLKRLSEVGSPRVALREVSGDQLEGSRDTCNYMNANCSSPLRGGVEIGLHNAEWGICTTAFHATGLTDHKKYILSAGHCAAAGHAENPTQYWDAWDEQRLPYNGENHYLGQLGQYAFPSHDWMKVDVTGSWWDTPQWRSIIAYWKYKPWNTVPNETAIMEEYPILAEGNSYVGQGVCHSGITTGGSCGQVTAVDVTYNFGEGPTTYNLTKVHGACGEAGDSGGPYFASNIAYGIHIGSDGAFGGCNINTYYEEITDASAALGVTVVGGPPEVATESATNGQPHNASLRGQVTPNGWLASSHFEFGQGSFSNVTPEESSTSNGMASIAREANVTGLKGSTTYQFRIVATNTLGTTYGPTQYFTTPDWRPITVTEAATAVKGHSATLHANVNPQGAATSYHFEYGTTTGYGTSVPIPAADIGSGAAGVEVENAIAGLTEATVYHFRVSATNSEGTAYGADREFRTPGKPIVGLGEALYTNTLEPRLGATVNPNGAETTYQVEYGTTVAYGSKAPLKPEAIGSALANLTVGQYLSGLQAASTYHFRVVAENEVGTSAGPDNSFTSLPPCKVGEGKCAWSTQTAVDPPPFTEDELKDVSCPSSTVCLAVGYNGYSKESFLESWSANTWRLVQSISGEVKRISCPAANACVAVGVGASGAAQSWTVNEIGGAWGGQHPRHAGTGRGHPDDPQRRLLRQHRLHRRRLLPQFPGRLPAAC